MKKDTQIFTIGLMTIDFQNRATKLSLIQTWSHIPPRSTSFSSGPSFFLARLKSAAPGITSEDLNSSNSHIYNVKLALVELSRQICSPNGAPRSSDLGVSFFLYT